MTLFSSLYVGSSAIQANQFALRVVGNNIANAATDGYVRQEVSLGTLDTIRAGSLTFGAGVRTASVRQQIDRQLNERSRQAGGEFQAADAQASLLRRVEILFNELSEGDLSSVLGKFFDSLQDVANQPDNLALRSTAIQNGDVAAGLIRDIRSQLDRVVSDINTEVTLAADQINGIVDAVRRLNTSIVQAESGSPSDAGDLRTERDRLLAELSGLIEIQVHEQPGGSVNVLTNGDYLLFNGTIQEVGAVQDTTDGRTVTKLVFERSQFGLARGGGRIGGIQEFRDSLLPAISDSLDELARSLIHGFNQLHSEGQGLFGYRDLEGTYRAIDPTAAMNTEAAGLEFVPRNGSFQVIVTDQVTGQAHTYDITVDLNGIGPDDGLVDVANRINSVAFAGQPVATVNAQGRLEMHAAADQTFTFANDSSGFLAALGLNSFFTGTDSRSIYVNDTLAANPGLLAVSKNGQPGNNENALRMSQFGETGLAELGGQTLSSHMTSIVQQLGATSQAATFRAEALRNTKSALEAEGQSISGVSLDEEAIKLLAFQRGFQASARFLQAVNEMMDELMGILR